MDDLDVFESDISVVQNYLKSSPGQPAPVFPSTQAQSQNSLPAQVPSPAREDTEIRSSVLQQKTDAIVAKILESQRKAQMDELYKEPAMEKPLGRPPLAPSGRASPIAAPNHPAPPLPASAFGPSEPTSGRGFFSGISGEDTSGAILVGSEDPVAALVESTRKALGFGTSFSVDSPNGFNEAGEMGTSPNHLTDPMEEAGASPDRRDRKSREALVDRINKEKYKECTFKPKTNTGFKGSVEVRGNFFERLESWQKLRQKQMLSSRSRLADQHDEGAECTFRPQLVSKKKAMVGGGSVDSRLYAEARERLEKRAELEQKVKKELLAECTFKPKIKKKPVATRKDPHAPIHRPIWNRVGELQRTERHKKHELRSKVFSEPENRCTFKPKINTTSSKIVQRLEENTKWVPNPHMRLSHKAPGAILRNLKRRSDKESKEKESCPFKPKVNPVSKFIIDTSDTIANVDFIERQKIFEQISHRNKHDLKAQKRRDENATFRPDIGNADRVLLKQPSLRTRYENEDEEMMADRLSNGDLIGRQNKQAILQAEYYGQFTYTPKLNPKSKKLGRASTIKELVQPERRSRVQRKLKEKQEDEFKKTHTFKPKTNRVNKFARSTGYNEPFPIGLIDDIDQRKASKEEKLTKARRLLEEQRMKECTFQPRTIPKPKPSKKPVFVRGVRKFMQRKKYADKLLEEEEQRKKKAFSVNQGILKERRNGRYTETKPFKFVGERSKAPKIPAPEPKELEDCTFVPRTCSRRNRELVKEILHDI